MGREIGLWESWLAKNIRGLARIAHLQVMAGDKNVNGNPTEILVVAIPIALVTAPLPVVTSTRIVWNNQYSFVFAFVLFGKKNSEQRRL